MKFIQAKQPVHGRYPGVQHLGFCVWTLEVLYSWCAADQNVGVDQWNVCQGSTDR